MLKLSSRRTPASLALATGFYILAAVQGVAPAQNSTQAPAPSSSKFSGSDVDGDPNGAVRALGSADDGNKNDKSMVTVPHLGGGDSGGTGGTPRGTTR